MDSINFVAVCSAFLNGAGAAVFDGDAMIIVVACCALEEVEATWGFQLDAMAAIAVGAAAGEFNRASGTGGSDVYTGISCTGLAIAIGMAVGCFDDICGDVKAFLSVQMCDAILCCYNLCFGQIDALQTVLAELTVGYLQLIYRLQGVQAIIGVVA